MSTMQKKSGLTSMPPPVKPPRRHPGYQPAGSCDAPEKRLSEGLLRAVTRHIVRHYTPLLREQAPPRWLVIQGEPGTGKSTQTAITGSRAGVDVLMVPAATLSGAKEGAPIAVLEEVAEAVLEITAETKGRPLALLLDDLDLSIAVPVTDDVGTSINSQLLISYIHDICDKGLIRSAHDVPVPLIATVNNATMARSSLFRPGRAEFYTHQIDDSEKLAIVATMLGLEPSRPLEKLVLREHAHQPIAFWAAVKVRLHDERVDRAYQAHGLDPVAIDAALRAETSAIDLEALRRTAAMVAAATARNFLTGGKHGAP